MKAASPTHRSLELLRIEGWTAQLVESRIPGAAVHRSRDLFGCIDIIAVRGPDTLAVQTTSASNITSRIRKVTDSEHLPAMRDAGWRIEVHGWYADGRVRVEDLS